MVRHLRISHSTPLHNRRYTRLHRLHTHHIHVHDNPLEVGKTYYFVMENNDNGCHRVLSAKQSEGRHAEATSIAYDDCAECQAAN